MKSAAAAMLSLLVSLNVSMAEDIVVRIPGMGSSGPYRLGETHIFVNSEQIIYREAVLAKDVDYRIDYNDGFVIFNYDIPQADTVRISFEIAPIEIKSSYAHRQPVAYAIVDSLPRQVRPDVTGKTGGSDLDIVGSKGFAINIGDIGEPSLTQSLDLSITGQLTRDVFVRGSVSDRNFNGSSSGATRSLDELDRIFLSIESKYFRGDFGDLELKGINGSLLNYQRKLTGLSLSGDAGRVSGKAALAFSPGEEVEIFFYGVDGKQGPYLLNAANVSVSSLVGEVFLPGTEEVYLDGVRLDRGSENDYTIDYYERYIQFSPRNVISSNSRITVKIQLAPEGYRRGFYHIEAGTGGAVQIGMQYVGEHDDNGSPRNFEMGDTEREAIAAAGAERDSAYSSGAQFVGPGEGNYTPAIDSLGRTYYEYTGDGAGDYLVSFSRVGQGSGSYEYAGTGKYLYVGDANGSYLPVIYFPLPESRDYGSVFLKKVGDLHLDGELALSRSDRNSLSVGDKLLTGTAFSGSAGYGKRNIELLGRRFDAELLQLKIRSLDSEFSSPGIIDRPEFFRDYNLPQSRTIAGERLYEFQSSAASESGESLAAGAGLFDGERYRARRAFSNMNIEVLDRLMAVGSAELSWSEDKSSHVGSSWNKYETGIKTVEGLFRPGLLYRHELNEGRLISSDGYEGDEYEAFVTVGPLEKVNTSSRITYRRQQHIDSAGVRQPEFDRYKLEQGIKYGGAGSNFSGELNYARLYEKETYPVNGKLTRNMGDIKLNYNSPDFGVTFYESVNASGRVLRAREYVYVGDGKGDFRRDGDDYVPEPGGDYIEVIRQLGEADIDQSGGYEITGGLRIRLNARVLTDDKFLSRLSYDGDLNNRTNIAGDGRFKAGYLSPLGKFDADAMTYKSYDFRQRTTFKLSRAGDYLRHTLRVSRSDGSNYQFEQLSDMSRSNSADLKLFSRATVGFLAAAEFAAEKKWLYSGNVDLIKVRAQVVPEWRPLATVRVEIPLEYVNEDERIKELKIDIYSVGLKTTVNVRNYGRFELSGDYARVKLDKDEIFIPYVVAGGRKAGNNYNALVTARFKLNSYSRIDLRYTYKELGDGYNNSTLRLEARAEF